MSVFGIVCFRPKRAPKKIEHFSADAEVKEKAVFEIKQGKGLELGSIENIAAAIKI